MKRKKKVEPICGNCRLFNPDTNKCGVAVLISGEQFHLPVEPEDQCFFEERFFYENNKGELEHFTPEIQQARWWTEDEKGQKTDGNGKVMIEYPEGFFGQEKD